jgi:6-phosphogluconolactonase (cycloisomerase 2 family)
MSARVTATVLTATMVGVSGCSNADADSPAGLLVTHWGSSTVSAFRLDADGAITPDPTVTKAARGTENLQGSVRSHDNRRLYVANWGSGNITAYRLTAKGKLDDPVSVSATPAAVRPSSLALAPDGRHLYLANDADGKEATISHFPLTADGEPQAGTTVASHGTGTTSVTVTPNGRTLLAASPGSGTVTTFRLDAGGAPVFVQRTNSGRGTFFTAVADGGTVVVATNAGEDTLSLFRLGADSTLDLVTKVPAGAHEPRGLVVDSSGTHAYVANFNGGSGAGSVTAFRIGAKTLTPLVAATPTGSAGSEGLALAEDGRSLYVANFNKDGDGSVASYRVGDDGTLGPLRGPVPTGGRQPDLTSITVARQAP